MTKQIPFILILNQKKNEKAVLHIVVKTKGITNFVMGYFLSQHGRWLGREVKLLHQFNLLG